MFQSDSAAFLSYTHFDDDANQGYISRLRASLSVEVQVQTGIEFPIFQDKDDVLLGQRWLQRIELQLDSTTFLIAVLTPSFFRSETCRREVERFGLREAALGVDDLIVPIYFVATPELDADSDDELAQDMRGRQWADWRPLRFVEIESNEARLAITELAIQIVERLRRPVVTASPDIQDASEISDNEGPEVPLLGPMELLAEMEEAFPIFNSIIVSLGEEMEAFATITGEATKALERATKSPTPSRARLAAIQRYSQQLEEPAERIGALSTDYSLQLARVDAGVDAMAGQLKESNTQEDYDVVVELHETLGRLSESARAGAEGARSMIVAMVGPTKLSSTLRPRLARISSGLAVVIDSVPTIESWETRIGDAVDELRNRLDRNDAPDGT